LADVAISKPHKALLALGAFFSGKRISDLHEEGESKLKKCLLPTIAASAVLLLLATLGGNVVGQDAAKKQDAGKKQDKQKKEFAQQLWSYLKKVEYRENYSPWPGTEDAFYEGQAPHGAKLKMYVNRHVANNPADPPYKSVIIKENYTPEEKLAAITIMYRVEDYDPDNNDWYWVKYQPDGKVAMMNDMKLAGKVKGCINCHSTAKGDDYIFTNDE